MSFPYYEKYSHLHISVKNSYNHFSVTRHGVFPLQWCFPPMKVFHMKCKSVFRQLSEHRYFSKNRHREVVATSLRGSCTTESMIQPHLASQASAKSSLKQALNWQQRNNVGCCRNLDFIIRETRKIALKRQVYIWLTSGWLTKFLESQLTQRDVDSPASYPLLH